jgi:hypothetical protein
MPGLMSGDWKRSTVSGPQRLQRRAWTAPDLSATAPALDSTPRATLSFASLPRLRGHNDPAAGCAATLPSILNAASGTLLHADLEREAFPRTGDAVLISVACWGGRSSSRLA